MSLRELLVRYEKVIGTIASILAIIMFISLIEILLSNIKGESNIFIQPLATGFNGFFWSLYAYSRKDLFLLAPNILACVLGFVTASSVLL